MGCPLREHEKKPAATTLVACRLPSHNYFGSGLVWVCGNKYVYRQLGRVNCLIVRFAETRIAFNRGSYQPSMNLPAPKPATVIGG
jgi:hypothetical protein